MNVKYWFLYQIDKNWLIKNNQIDKKREISENVAKNEEYFLKCIQLFPVIENYGHKFQLLEIAEIPILHIFC